MRVVVELKRDAVPQIVLNKLYKLTPMQSTFGVINLAIVAGQPRVLTLRQMLEQHASVEGHVVDPLLRLMLDHVEKVERRQIDDVPLVDDHLVDRHGPDRHRRRSDDRFANAVDVLAR